MSDESKEGGTGAAAGGGGGRPSGPGGPGRSSSGHSASTAGSEARRAYEVHLPPDLWSHRFDDKFFNVTVPAHELRHDASGSAFRVFLVTLRCGSREDVIPHRYSEFDALAEELEGKKLPSGRSVRVSQLPRKTWFSRPTADDEFMEERRAGLEYFLVTLLNQKGAPSLPQLRAFLRLDEPASAPA